MANEVVKYESGDGQMVEFTAKEVKDRLCPNATDKELALLMALCQAQKLNPFVKDVYLIKYGDHPATMVTSKEVFTKRAQANPKFDGMEAGITILRNGQLERREGSMLLEGEELVGGWCRVYVKNYRAAIFDEVSMREYYAPDKYKKNGWAKMPATMIRKVALCHALREAFPDDFQGLYGAEEMGKAGETVVEAENGTLESVTATADAKSSASMDVEFVEMASDAQIAEISTLKEAIADAKEKNTDEIWEAARNSKSARDANVSESVDQLTAEQANVVIDLLRGWVEKCNTTEKDRDIVAEALAIDTGLYDEDVPF